MTVFKQHLIHQSRLNYIDKYYVQKGTHGLKAFMQTRNYDVQLWVKLITAYPKFWKSVRTSTLLIKNKASQLEKSIARLKELYPQLKPAEIYFTIGELRSGGTTEDNMVLIGAEISAADSNTVTSEFPDK
jgi:hypothetical protein